MKFNVEFRIAELEFVLNQARAYESEVASELHLESNFEFNSEVSS